MTAAGDPRVAVLVRSYQVQTKMVDKISQVIVDADIGGPVAVVSYGIGPIVEVRYSQSCCDYVSLRYCVDCWHDTLQKLGCACA